MGGALSTAQTGTGRHCSALAAQLLKHKNRYCSPAGFFFFIYMELSNAYCSWHCHRKWRIILCTLWKQQAQENPNRFNSIWVSLSYFKLGFFSLWGKKRKSGQSLPHYPVHFLFFFFFPFSLPLFVLERNDFGYGVNNLFKKLTVSLMPPSFSAFLSHKQQMQMWLCLFPINSSRQRVSSRSQPQFSTLPKEPGEGRM